MRPLFLSLVLLSATDALAAEITEMPPGLRGDLRIDYHGGFLNSGLVEAGQEVARQRLSQHHIDVRAEFAPIEGVAIWTELPITALWQLNYDHARGMVYDPATRSGSFQGRELSSPPSLRGSGFWGMWLGAAVSPIAERYAPHQLVTWRLDAGLRTGTPNHNRWTTSDLGRGAAPGGTAWMLSGAFSTERGIATPYLGARVVREQSVEGDLVDDDGRVWASGVTFQAPSSVDISGGVELLAHHGARSGQRVVFDLKGSFGYRSWSDVPSGLYLPDVLEASRPLVVTRSEHLVGRAGLGVIYDLHPYFGVRASGELGYATPHRLEHIYPVHTSADGYELGLRIGIVARAR